MAVQPKTIRVEILTDFPTDADIEVLAEAIYDVESRGSWLLDSESIRNAYRDSVRRAIGKWVASRVSDEVGADKP